MNKNTDKTIDQKLKRLVVLANYEVWRARAEHTTTPPKAKSYTEALKKVIDMHNPTMPISTESFIDDDLEKAVIRSRTNWKELMLAGHEDKGNAYNAIFYNSLFSTQSLSKILWIISDLQITYQEQIDFCQIWNPELYKIVLDCDDDFGSGTHLPQFSLKAKAILLHLLEKYYNIE